MLHIVAPRRGASLSEVVADLAPCYPGAVRTIAADLDADLSATRLLVLRDERYFLRDPSVQPTAEAATEARAHAMNMIAEEERNITRTPIAKSDALLLALTVCRWSGNRLRPGRQLEVRIHVHTCIHTYTHGHATQIHTTGVYTYNPRTPC